LATSGLPQHEAQRLIELVTGLDRVAQIARPERVLSAVESERVTALFLRRKAGEPLAYMLGAREFWGLALKVSPAVLIPRGDTELLVELALERLGHDTAAAVLDLGTGSGAVAIAISMERPQADMTAIDISDAALSIARDNAECHGAKIRFLQGSWFEALENDGAPAQQCFDLIVGNPPYIAEGDPHLEQGDLPSEPRSALVAGHDGMSAIRAIVAGAGSRLASGGWLLLEHGFEQGGACRNLLLDAGFTSVQTWPDLAGLSRVSGGRIDAER
jgi:release factor glutamine methyltransferase